jgi:uncharacterized membrane protein YphA (DoxX/SURF4 family)
MNTTEPNRQRRSSGLIALLARWLLGGLFIYLGVIKVRHGADFATFVHQQLMVTNPLLSGLIVATAPWVEVLYGLWLISGFGLGAAAVVARWWLGGEFIFMGLHKAVPHPEAFLKLVLQYDIVTRPPWLNSIGAAMPWFEVYCGVLLLVGVAVRGTALNLIAMLVPFTYFVLKRALEIMGETGLSFCKVKFDCGCGAGEVYICHKLVENTILVLLAAWLLTGAGRRLCLRYGLRRDSMAASRRDD